MDNLEDYILSGPFRDHFKTVVIDNVMLVDYQCLHDGDIADIWTHNNYFAYVLGGQKKWKTPSAEYLVKSREALFVRKGVTTVYQYFQQPFLVLFVFLSDARIRSFQSQYADQLKFMPVGRPAESTLYPLLMDPALETVFQSILAYLQTKEAIPEAIWQLKIDELLLQLLTRKQSPDLQKLLLGLGKDRDHYLRSVMCANFCELLDLKDYARMCERSVSTFQRDFKSVFGETPARWLQEKRLAHARLLIATTNKTIADVALESGFRNASHFTRSFRQRFGVPPGAIRDVIVPD